MSESNADNFVRGNLRQSSYHNVARRIARRLGRAVLVSGEEVYLTPTEHRLLDVFRRRPGHAFTRSELVALVMPDSVVLDRTIDVHVKSLRRKLAGGSESIETVYRVGCRLALV